MRDGELFVKLFDGHEMETTLDDFEKNTQNR